jgi:hypothetical protein
VSAFFYAKICSLLARRRSSQPVQRVYWPENVSDWLGKWRPTCVMRHARGRKLQSFRHKWPFYMDLYSMPLYCGYIIMKSFSYILKLFTSLGLSSLTSNNRVFKRHQNIDWYRVSTKTQYLQSLYINHHTHTYGIFSSKFQSIFIVINQMERMNFRYSLTDSLSSMRTVEYLYNFTHKKVHNHIYFYYA